MSETVTAPPPGTTRIVLHGRLRREFGECVNWGCPTPAHAIYALMTMKPGFRNALGQGSFRVVRGSLDSGLDLDEDMLHVRFGRVRELHIVPTARGRGNGAGSFVKIILGVVLIGAAVLTAGGAIGVAAAAGAGASAGATAGGLAATLGLTNTLFGVTAGALGLFGFGLLLGGVGEILSHQPKAPLPNASFLLNGPTNTAQQGGPVPLAYGFRVRVGSVVIASSYIAQQMQVNNGGKGGNQGGNGNPF
jgi:predicted phage tail protein